jgi:hypothetical protein
VSASGAQPADVVGSVAGYRVLRRIGSADRSDIYLGASAGVGTNGQREVVVLKVFRDASAGDAAGDAAIDREVHALESIADGGVGRLLDVATLPDGRVCLVLAEDRGGSLGVLLAGERMLDPGEAVSILAPVLATLAGLYDRGWVHPEIGPGHVRFDDAGRPVVGGLGGLRDLPPPGQARDELLDEARCGCDELVQAVLDRVPERVRPGAAELFTSRRSDAFREALAGLEQALFDWSPAAPVRLPGPEVSLGGGATIDTRRLFPDRGRLARLESALDTPVGPLLRAWAVQVARTIGGRLTGVRLGPPAVRAHRDRAAHAFEPGTKPFRDRHSRPATRRRTWRAADDPARRRRRVLILSGASLVVILLVGGWAMLTPRAAGSGPDPTAVGTASSSPLDTSGGVSAAVDPLVVAGPRATDQEALRGEDPVGATVELLRLRARCIVAADRECLADIAQPDSPALAQDSGLIGQAPAEGRDASAQTVVDGSGPILVDRIGNLALVALSSSDPEVGPGNDEPASVLVVKGEAGWRLREFFGAG